jgi:hypothetical protein
MAADDVFLLDISDSKLLVDRDVGHELMKLLSMAKPIRYVWDLRETSSFPYKYEQATPAKLQYVSPSELALVTLNSDNMPTE